MKSQRGNVLLYILLAVGLLAALTYSYVQDSRENYSSQQSIHLAEQLFSQINMIKSAVIQCTLEYPMGGGDTDNDGSIGTTDNPNNPYPLNPSSALNASRKIGAWPGVSDPIAAAANDYVRNLTCVGAPAAAAYIFQGSGNQGRFLPPPPPGFTEWSYTNDSTGVFITITASATDAAAQSALTRIQSKFTSSQASVTGTTLKAWIMKN